MSKQTKPSSLQVSKVLRKSVFDPRKPGPMAVILDTANSDYLERRAVELILQGVSPRPVTQQGRMSRLQDLQMAIRLLAMSQLLMEQEEAPAKKPKTKTKELKDDGEEGLAQGPS